MIANAIHSDNLYSYTDSHLSQALRSKLNEESESLEQGAETIKNALHEVFEKCIGWADRILVHYNIIPYPNHAKGEHAFENKIERKGGKPETYPLGAIRRVHWNNTSRLVLGFSPITKRTTAHEFAIWLSVEHKRNQGFVLHFGENNEMLLSPISDITHNPDSLRELDKLMWEGFINLAEYMRQSVIDEAFELVIPASIRLTDDPQGEQKVKRQIGFLRE